MARARTRSTKRKHKRRKRSSFKKFLPSATTRRRWFKIFVALPGALQFVIVVAAVIAVWFVANGLYQVIRKPTELFFPVSGVLYKTPTQTWRDYAPIFRRHSTAIMTPELLAAIAQVEGSGNPVVRTYWRWSITHDPFEIYRPASSAVGMYQFTNGTFKDAKRFCIHNHQVVMDGPWHDPKSCWFNWLYMRVVPSHAVEMASAHLHHQITVLLRRHRVTNASLAQQQNLAAVIHLCGAGAANGYVRRGFQLTPGQRCGDHRVQHYLDKINAMKRTFAALAARDARG